MSLTQEVLWHRRGQPAVSWKLNTHKQMEKGNLRGNNCMKNSGCITCDLPAVTWPHWERPSGLEFSGRTYCSTEMGGPARTFLLKYFKTAHSQIYPFVCISADTWMRGVVVYIANSRHKDFRDVIFTFSDQNTFCELQLDYSGVGILKQHCQALFHPPL